MIINLEELMALKDHGNTALQRENNLRLVTSGDALLKRYFKKNPTADIALIREGALEFDYMIHNYSNRNIMLFTPESTYKLTGRAQSFEGTLMPSHPLLLFDSDMLTGSTIRQARDFFASKGYLEEQMSVYLHIGFTFDLMWPELKSLREMLRYRDLAWPEEFPKFIKPKAQDIAGLNL